MWKTYEKHMQIPITHWHIWISCEFYYIVLASSLEEVLGFGVGAVVDNTGKTVAFRIQDEVLAHHAKTDEAEVRLGHGLKDH